ncbi:hypothetical protein [Streptomyces albireticuli]|uniref:Uncharacterized protein n=1 Tax=Streptomyces albireticuli TaxID=1940 RepID=A0A2A2CWX5_9ACTN|nr:hypothetical protein [Streptomyces albireticuli]MCD9193413.1 hypothetical protein [Streptomyces albireticuli]PAU44693.1 hypothetical protein CK936_33500 [Streptomyces albireticuli]
MTSTSAPAQITLFFSRSVGIVAAANGEKYAWAQTALEASGFQRRKDGTYVLALGDPQVAQATLISLLRIADRHRSIVKITGRSYIRDVAEGIAGHLPGEWSVTVDVYSHPVWQEDLVPWLWDAGELSQAIQTTRIPYAAVLTDGTGINLLLTERPGHHHDYVVGAFAPDGFDDNYDEPHAPSSIVVPGAAQPSAHAISHRFLPAYHQAVHTRRTAAVASALGRIREEGQTWEAIKESGRYSDGSPLAPEGLPGAEEAFVGLSWFEFRDVLLHAPAVLERCRPADSAWPQDTAALDRLQGALGRGQEILSEWNARLEGLRATSRTPPRESDADVKAERDARMQPVIETWLADGDALLRQAGAAAPASPSAGPVRSHTVAALPPALPAPPGAVPARR